MLVFQQGRWARLRKRETRGGKAMKGSGDSNEREDYREHAGSARERREEVDRCVVRNRKENDQQV